MPAGASIDNSTGGTNAITDFAGSTTVINDGTISGNNNGIITIHIPGTNLNVENNGTIEGNNNGVSGVVLSGSYTLENNGTISGNTLNGVFAAVVTGTTSIENNSIIEGANTGVFTSMTSGNANTQNSGIINGNIGVFGATITGSVTVENSGTITGDTGVTLSSTTGNHTIQNTGTISGNNGVYASTINGTVNVDNSGGIYGETTGLNIQACSSSVINTGTISNSDASNAAVLVQSGSGCSVTVENYGTITNTGGGEAINLGDGNDTLFQDALVPVGGNLNGGNGTDTLNFMYTFESEDFRIPAEYEAMRAQLAALPTVGCPCTVTLVVEGRAFAYTYLNFEKLDAFLNFIKLTFTPYDDMGCQNGVKCFALKNRGFRNGNVQIFATVDQQGVGIATVNFNLLGIGGYSFTNPDNGWAVEIVYLGSEGDARLYSISISNGGDVRHAMIQVLAFQMGDQNATTNALAWR